MLFLLSSQTMCELHTNSKRPTGFLPEDLGIQSPFLFCLFFFFNIIIYMLVSGLSCSTQDLCCSMRDPSLCYTGFSHYGTQA